MKIQRALLSVSLSASCLAPLSVALRREEGAGRYRHEGGGDEHDLGGAADGGQRGLELARHVVEQPQRRLVGRVQPEHARRVLGTVRVQPRPAADRVRLRFARGEARAGALVTCLFWHELASLRWLGPKRVEAEFSKAASTLFARARLSGLYHLSHYKVYPARFFEDFHTVLVVCSEVLHEISSAGKFRLCSVLPQLRPLVYEMECELLVVVHSGRTGCVEGEIKSEVFSFLQVTEFYAYRSRRAGPHLIICD